MYISQRLIFKYQNKILNIKIEHLFIVQFLDYFVISLAYLRILRNTEY